MQPIIFASKIRIYPYGQYDRTVCLRAEIVGCPWEGKFQTLKQKIQKNDLTMKSRKTVNTLNS